jgi:hypothetical protein
LADLADVDRGADLLWNLLAGLLRYLLAFFPGNTDTSFFWDLHLKNNCFSVER